MNNVLRIVIIALFVLCSAFFSSSEIALASAGKSRLSLRLKERPKSIRIKLALKIKEKYDEYLSAILIGNNLVNNAASSIAAVIIISAMGEKFAFVSTLIMTVIVLIFGEMVPKVFGKQFAEQISVAFSLPVVIISVIFKPITYLVMLFVNGVSVLWRKRISDSETVSADDLENIIDIAEDEGVIDEEQSDMLQNALFFDDVAAFEIITPRVDMTALDIHDSYEVNLQKIYDTNFSRLPVYEDTPDNVIGILLVNRFYKQLVNSEKVSIRDILLPVTYVHKTMSLPSVLEKMKETKSHMVVVLDEYGGTMGILTMEDVMEQLVGEIFDENDGDTPEFVCIDDSHFEADGGMRVYDFFDEFDIDIEDEEDFEENTATIGGFVTDLLEGEAAIGATVTFNNLKITVLSCDEKRIDKIAVEVLEDKEEDEE